MRRHAPWRVFYRPLCGFDLAAARTAPDGSCVCPECARAVRDRREARTSPRALRWRNITAVLMALMLGAWCSGTVRRGDYIRWLPSDALIWVRAHVASQIPLLNRELIGRLARRELTPPQQSALSWAVIDDLRDDDVKWNADYAQSVLSSAGPLAHPALQHALQSDDRQQRGLAWLTLSGEPGFQPSSSFMHATYAQMREDGEYGRAAMHYLVENPWVIDHAELARVIGSGDPRQRLIASAVAGLARRDALIDNAFPVLLKALHDNDVGSDAKLASRALAGFSPEVLIPRLAPLVDHPDHQTRTVARELLSAAGAPAPLVQTVDARPALITDCGLRLARLELYQLPAPHLRSERPETPESPSADDRPSVASGE